MLEDPDALVRQAAAFGLGELGGTPSTRRLELQLTIENARGDYDGEYVVETITQALGRIEEASARAPLVRRLERLAMDKPTLGDLSTIARALWRKRHPDILPAVRRSLERIAPVKSKSLLGLQLLLENPPEELRTWAVDPSVPVDHKTGVILLLEEELPEELRPTLPAFISAAHSVAAEAAANRRGGEADFCDRLIGLLLQHREQLLPSFSPETRSELYDLTRTLVTTTAPICFLGAAILLQFIGHPEDAELLETHRPAEPALAKVFDDAARALRGLQED
jgi:hypothetical protein